MKKKILVGLLVLISCIFAFAAEGDNIDELTVTLEVAPFGPYAYFTDDFIRDPSAFLKKKAGADELLSPVGTGDSSGNWAKGSVYATIITNQTGLTTTVGWNDLSNGDTTTVIPLSVTCSTYYVNGSEKSISDGSASDTESNEDSKSNFLSLPNDDGHGKRAVSYKLDMSVTNDDYLAADAAKDGSNYEGTMTLTVSTTN